MMKNMKKLAALALALMMTASLLSTAALATDIGETVDEEVSEEILTVETPAEKPCSVTFIYAPAGAADGAVTAPEGVTAPGKIERDETFRLSKADLSYGSGEIPDGYAFSGWYIQDSGRWYLLEDVLRMLIIHSHTEVYGCWTYTAPEKPVDPPVNPPVDPEEKPEVPEEKPEVPEEKPVDPEEKPEVPEEKPEVPEEKPEVPEEKPEVPEEKPETPDNGNNDNNDNQTPGNPNPPVTPPTNTGDVTIDKTETPPAPALELVEEESEISEEETPLAVLPETAPETGDAVIVDEAAPLGELPQTGTVLRVEFPAALGLGVLTLSLAMAGLAVVLSRKKEEN